MKIAFSKPEQTNSGSLVVGVSEDRKMSPAAAALDKKSGGILTRAMASSRFKGKKDDLLEIVAPKGLSLARIVLIGLGKLEKLDALRLQGMGGQLVAFLNRVGETVATMQIDTLPGVPLQAPDMAAHIAYGAKLRSYRFDKYRTREKEESKPTLRSFNFMVTDVAAARKASAPLDRLADAIFFTRDLVSEPPNVIYPETLAERCKRLTAVGVKVEILDEKQLTKLGFNALLGVAQGSVRPPRVVILQWNGAPKAKDKRPIAFCGKGVTFDTGGISIKPSGTAQRPSDIVKSLSGKTIEVLNTDAEGRLVLCDVMWYVQDRFKPKALVDLATLTGAVIVALGHEYAGIFSNNDDLTKNLIAAGDAVGERLWRLPLGEAYDRDIDSDAADVKNIGGARVAGSTIGAQFLARFVNDVPWAHLDIAGVAWSKKDMPTVPKGATAFGVRLLDRLVADHYEEPA